MDKTEMMNHTKEPWYIVQNKKKMFEYEGEDV